MFEANTFLRGILFEENPLGNETPDEVAFFDMNGNEVSINGDE